MATNKTFADRLTKLRENTGKKRQEVADELEISRASLEYYEKGKRKPDIEVLAKIAEYYKVSTDYLLGLSIASTTDKDVQFICDYTGLSEYAVDVLHFYSKYDLICPTINKLLESEVSSVLQELGYIYSDIPKEELKKICFENNVDFNEVVKVLETKDYNCLQVVSAIENYLNYKKAAPTLDKWLSIAKSGNIISLSETDLNYTKKLTWEDLMTIKTVKQSELIENVLFENVIDKIKQLKGGESNGKYPQA